MALIGEVNFCGMWVLNTLVSLLLAVSFPEWRIGPEVKTLAIWCQMAFLIGRPFTEGGRVCSRNMLLAAWGACNYIAVIHVILFTQWPKHSRWLLLKTLIVCDSVTNYELSKLAIIIAYLLFCIPNAIDFFYAAPPMNYYLFILPKNWISTWLV